MIADLEMQRAIDRYHRVGVAALSDEERTLATIWYFESKVSNSGFEHFFRSPEGELARFAPAAFRAIGAEALAGFAERANAVFGADGVPADQERRAQWIDAMPDHACRAFDELDDQYAERAPDLDGYIEGYLSRRARMTE